MLAVKGTVLSRSANATDLEYGLERSVGHVDLATLRRLLDSHSESAQLIDRYAWHNERRESYRPSLPYQPDNLRRRLRGGEQRDAFVYQIESYWQDIGTIS